MTELVVPFGEERGDFALTPFPLVVLVSCLEVSTLLLSGLPRVLDSIFVGA